MTEQTTHQPDATTAGQRLAVQTAWQAWSKATADWAAQLQHLQTTNFVFRTVWDPETRASCRLKFSALREAALHAQQTWAIWQAQVEATSQTQFARLSEIEEAWTCVLQELAYAETADEYFLPDDAHWLAARTYRRYQQILYATEQAKDAVQAWLPPPSQR